MEERYFQKAETAQATGGREAATRRSQTQELRAVRVAHTRLQNEEGADRTCQS